MQEVVRTATDNADRYYRLMSPSPEEAEGEARAFKAVANTWMRQQQAATNLAAVIASTEVRICLSAAGEVVVRVSDAHMNTASAAMDCRFQPSLLRVHTCRGCGLAMSGDAGIESVMPCRFCTWVCSGIKPVI